MKSLIRTHLQVPFNSNTQISQTPTPQPPVSPQDNTFCHSPQHLELPPIRWTFWQKPNLFRKLRPGVSVVGSEKWKRHTNENAPISPVLPKVMGEKQQRDLARTAQFFARFAESAVASALLIRAITRTTLPPQPPVIGQ